MQVAQHVVAGHLRHHQIQHHNVVFARRELAHRVSAAHGLLDEVAVLDQHRRIDLTQYIVVIDHQNPRTLWRQLLLERVLQARQPCAGNGSFGHVMSSDFYNPVTLAGLPRNF